MGRSTPLPIVEAIANTRVAPGTAHPDRPHVNPTWFRRNRKSRADVIHRSSCRRIRGLFPVDHRDTCRWIEFRGIWSSFLQGRHLSRRCMGRPAHAGTTIATSACGTGERYLSTPLSQLIGMSTPADADDFDLEPAFGLHPGQSMWGPAGSRGGIFRSADRARGRARFRHPPAPAPAGRSIAVASRARARRHPSAAVHARDRMLPRRVRGSRRRIHRVLRRTHHAEGAAGEPVVGLDATVPRRKTRSLSIGSAGCCCCNPCAGLTPWCSAPPAATARSGPR
jgi:hypothetical protein